MELHLLASGSGSLERRQRRSSSGNRWSVSTCDIYDHERRKTIEIAINILKTLKGKVLIPSNFVSAIHSEIPGFQVLFTRILFFRGSRVPSVSGF